MELHTGAIGMGQRLQAAEGAMQKIHDSQQELTLQDPERRLYSRAAKMVELGADLDEVMSECEVAPGRGGAADLPAQGTELTPCLAGGAEASPVFPYPPWVPRQGGRYSFGIKASLMGRDLPHKSC